MSNIFDHLSIGNRIRFARKLLNKTQTDLGDYLGIDRRAVSAIEKGEPCSRKRYIKIADYLDVDLEYLLFGENDLVRNLYTKILKATSNSMSNPALSLKKIINQYRSVIEDFEDLI